jgi:hypothetical protein
MQVVEVNYLVKMNSKTGVDQSKAFSRFQFISALIKKISTTHMRKLNFSLKAYYMITFSKLFICQLLCLSTTISERWGK